MDVSDARRPKALEPEHATLERFCADAMLDNTVLQDLLGEKWRRPPRGGTRSPMPSRPTA